MCSVNLEEKENQNRCPFHYICNFFLKIISIAIVFGINYHLNSMCYLILKKKIGRLKQLNNQSVVKPLLLNNNFLYFHIGPYHVRDSNIQSDF